MYIFVRFINSLLKPWLNKIDCTNEIGCAGEMGCINGIGCGVSKVEVGVSVVVCKVGFLMILVLVLVLAKLFLKR